MSRIGNQFAIDRTAERKTNARKTSHEFAPDSIPAYGGSEIAAARAARYCWKCGETDEHGNHPRIK